jgi:hypothetical protein
MNHAIIHAHIAVRMPCNGVPPLATASEMDSGIEMRLTVSHALMLGMSSLIVGSLNLSRNIGKDSE